MSRTSAGELEKILFLKLLEDAAFYLDKLVGQQKRQQCVRERINGDVESHQLVDEDESVRDCEGASSAQDR